MSESIAKSKLQFGIFCDRIMVLSIGLPFECSWDLAEFLALLLELGVKDTLEPGHYVAYEEVL